MKTISKYNFDHPDAMDWDLIKSTFNSLLNNTEDVFIPRYNYVSC
jgi:uridine kinase